MKACVIGGGVGGLASAIQLQRAGIAVTLFERAGEVGGKLRQVEVGGRRFDAGPSVLTMRWVFDTLFLGELSRYVTLQSVEPLCRHFFGDGSVLDLFSDEGKSAEAILAFAGSGAAAGYRAYRKHAAKIFETVREPFIENALPSAFHFAHPRALGMLRNIDAFRTLWRALAEFFPDPRLQQLFGRYATYAGSSPFLAPATLSVIAHVENALGVFACKGGIFALAHALRDLATELGVKIVTGADVDKIEIENGRARAVHVQGERVAAEIIVANGDIADLAERLLAHEKIGAALAQKTASRERSLSAFVWLALAAPPEFSLAHHNVFFSRDYRHEFEELLTLQHPPLDPTVYVNAQDRAPGESPSGAERFFFLTNSPPLTDRAVAIDWASESVRARDRIVRTVERHRWHLSPTAERAITPDEMAALFPGSRGSLYGFSSNAKMAAFQRPQARVKGIKGLYLAGGCAHPGAGLPMVALSGKIAAAAALADFARD